MEYLDFLESKRQKGSDSGLPLKWLPDCAFDFQAAVIEKAVNRGRIGVFADTGLGKTLMQLTYAYNMVLHTNKRVLILTPLAVAFQFLKEAERKGGD